MKKSSSGHKTIWKFMLSPKLGEQKVGIPKKAKLMCIKAVKDTIMMWFYVPNTEAPKQSITFFVYPTGSCLQDDFPLTREHKHVHYIDSVMLFPQSPDRLVFHIFGSPSREEYVMPDPLGVAEDEEEVPAELTARYLEETSKFTPEMMELLLKREETVGRGEKKVFRTENEKGESFNTIVMSSLEANRRIIGEISKRGWNELTCLTEEL